MLYLQCRSDPQNKRWQPVPGPEGVDPIFGTLADFDRLVGELHRRNVRVITDDGRGLDRNRIREKAIERGLLSESHRPLLAPTKLRHHARCRGCAGLFANADAVEAKPVAYVKEI